MVMLRIVPSGSVAAGLYAFYYTGSGKQAQGVVDCRARKCRICRLERLENLIDRRMYTVCAESLTPLAESVSIISCVVKLYFLIGDDYKIGMITNLILVQRYILLSDFAIATDDFNKN